MSAGSEADLFAARLHRDFLGGEHGGSEADAEGVLGLENLVRPVGFGNRDHLLEVLHTASVIDHDHLLACPIGLDDDFGGAGAARVLHQFPDYGGALGEHFADAPDEAIGVDVAGHLGGGYGIAFLCHDICPFWQSTKTQPPSRAWFGPVRVGVGRFARCLPNIASARAGCFAPSTAVPLGTKTGRFVRSCAQPLKKRPPRREGLLHQIEHAKQGA
jgi:hypothetical protein